jgi:hypothetical protein
MYDIYDFLNGAVGKIVFGGIFIAALLGSTRGCNEYYNSVSISTPAYRVESHATGISGHVEFTTYSDGSRDIKIYPSFGHRLFDSELHQDLDGDGRIDRIRRNSGEMKMNRLGELLIRNFDYDMHQERFDKADERLRKLMDKYPTEE